MSRCQLVIEWESAGHPDQDHALVDEIVDHAWSFIDGYDPSAAFSVDGSLVMTETAAPSSPGQADQ